LGAVSPSLGADRGLLQLRSRGGGLEDSSEAGFPLGSMQVDIDVHKMKRTTQFKIDTPRFKHGKRWRLQPWSTDRSPRRDVCYWPFAGAQCLRSADVPTSFEQAL